MEEQPKYDLETARDEASQIKDMVGEKATSLDYEVANKLIEQEKSDLIQKAQNIDEIIELVKKFGIIPGSQKNYYPEKIIKRIEQIRHGHVTLEFLTHKYNLRTRVEELLPSDEKYRRYVLGKRGKQNN